MLGLLHGAGRLVLFLDGLVNVVLRFICTLKRDGEAGLIDEVGD